MPGTYIVYECLNGWIVAWTEGLPCTVVQVSYRTPRYAIQTVAMMFSLCAHVPRISHVTTFNPPNTPPFKWGFLHYADMDLGIQWGCYLPRFTEGVSRSGGDSQLECRALWLQSSCLENRRKQQLEMKLDGLGLVFSLNQMLRSLGSKGEVETLKWLFFQILSFKSHARWDPCPVSHLTS